MTPPKKKPAPRDVPDPFVESKFEPLPEFPIFDQHQIPEVDGDPRYTDTASITRVMRFVAGNMRVELDRMRQEGIQTIVNLACLADLPYHYVQSLVYYQGVMDGVRLMQQQQEKDQAAIKSGRVM